MDSSKRLLKAGDFMGGGKGGGGSSQIAEGGFPEELKPFIMNTIVPFAQQWVQGQQAFPGSTNPGYLASGIDWGGKTKAPWMDEWNYNPGKITLGQARQSAYPEPKKTTLTSTQQNISSPIFGSGVTGWQGVNQPYPWSTGQGVGIKPRITPQTTPYMANSKTNMRGV